jgi:DNA-binding SARP family transcriptional activator
MWWRRLAASRPYDARVTRKLVDALDAAGDRASAIRQVEIHNEMLRDLDAEPDHELSELARRLRLGESVRPNADARSMSSPIASPGNGNSPTARKASASESQVASEVRWPEPMISPGARRASMTVLTAPTSMFRRRRARSA